MFEQMILPEPPRGKKWTMLLALVGQAALIGVLVLIPMLTVQELPLAQLSAMVVAPPPPPPPPPPPAPAAATAPRAVHVAPRHFNANQLFAPKTVPKTVAVLPDLPPEPAEAPAIAGVQGGVPGGQIGGVVGGVLGGVIGGLPSVAPPPPPPPPAKALEPAAPKLIRVGGQVEAAKVISAPAPIYPVLAKDARVGGIVHLDATIGEDGHIENLKVLSGPPLLINAAMDAVKLWTYHPTILNGKPVKVETQIMVNFQLG
jgi:protein TonB